MNIFVAGDADGAGQLVGRARLQDDVETMRKLSHGLDAGNDLWAKWAESHGGNMIEAGGDEFCCEVSAEYLSEVPGLRSQYADLVGATLSVGIGMRVSEASKALLAAKLKGKDQIVFYSEECDKLIQDAEKNQQSEQAKIVDEYLHKAAPAMATGDGAGFAGATRPSAPTTDKPVATQGDSSEEQALAGVVDGGPGAPEQTHAGADFERQLHDEAFKGEEEDMANDGQKAANLDQIKQQLAQALQVLKVQAPVMEQVKQIAPQAYQAMIGLAQSVVGMARELAPAQPMAKSEALAKSDAAEKNVEKIRTAQASDMQKPESKGSGHCAKGHCYVAAEALSHLLGGNEAGWQAHHVSHEGGPHWFLKHNSGRVLDPTADAFNTPVPYDQGAPSKFLTGDLPSANTKKLLDQLLGDGEIKQSALEKATKLKEKALTAPADTAREELVHYSVKQGLKRVDVNKMGTSGVPSQEYRQGIPDVGRAYFYRAGSAPEPLVTQGAKAKYKATLGPEHRLYDIGKDPDQLRAAAHSKFLAGEGLESPEDTYLNDVKGKGYYGYHNSASQLPHVVALFHPHPVEPMGKDEMDPLDKAGLPMPGVAAHHHVVLPTGSTVGKARAGAVGSVAGANKIKVAHSDGSQGYVQVQAGIIRSQDPAGHPVSSRSPNSK